MMIRVRPNHPCKGTLDFSFSIFWVLILVVIPQVYTETVKYSCKCTMDKCNLTKSFAEMPMNNLNQMDRLPLIHRPDEPTRIAGYYSELSKFGPEKRVCIFVSKTCSDLTDLSLAVNEV
jgi:hypothetical protein